MLNKKAWYALINNEISAGSYNIKFDATGLPSGVYFYRLEAEDINITKKMTLMKWFLEDTSDI